MTTQAQAAAARRPMTAKELPMDRESAAELLGCPVSEVVDVVDIPAGQVVAMTDGSEYVVVPEDRPDGDGKTGLMYHKLPIPGYNGSFPVYALHQGEEVAEPDVVEPADPDHDNEGEDDAKDGPDPAVPVRSRRSRSS